MTWSVQVPNPLQVGGNGANGEIDILDSNGNVVGQITTAKIVMGRNGQPQIILTDTGTLAEIQLPSGTSFEAGPATIAAGEYSPPGKNFVSMVIAGPQANTDNRSFVNFVMLSGSDTGSDHASLGVGYSPDGINVSTKLFISGSVIANDRSAPMKILNETWNSPSYVNGFSNSSPGVTYRLMPDGMVLLRGRVTSPATTTANETMFTLPAGYAPTQDFNMMINQIASATAFNKVHVDPSGNVQLGNPVSAITSFSLDGVRFAVI